MKDSDNNRQYAEISARHKEIVRRLCSPVVSDGDWNEFFAEIRGYVTAHYGGMLKRDINYDVEAFIQSELRLYFADDKCRRLREFLNLNDVACPHFGISWFTDHIRAAVQRTIEARREKLEIVDPFYSNASGEQESLIDSKTAQERIVIIEKPPAGEDRISSAIEQGGAPLLTAILACLWKTNPHECYSAIMDWWLKFDHRTIALFFGCKDVAAIAGYIRNLKRKLFDVVRSVRQRRDAVESDGEFIGAMFDRGLFRADGNCEDDVVEKLGRRRSEIVFRGERRGRGMDFQLSMRFPFEVCSDGLIRCTLSNSKGGGVNGRIFVCGKFRDTRPNGNFELPVSEFRNFYKSSEIYLEWENGLRSEAFPYVADQKEEYALSGTAIHRFGSVKMSDEDPIALAADLLNELGPVLTWLVISRKAAAELPFARFGMPPISRKTLRRRPGEAWLLFRSAVAVAEDSPLDANGFLLPVEWVYGGVRHSDRLPLNLTRLAERVRRAFDSEGWRLAPADRFFDGRVFLGDVSVFGRTEESVASAGLALAVALEYASRHIEYPHWPFCSIGWNFEENRSAPVGGLIEKGAIAETFGAQELFVSKEQCLPAGGTIRFKAIDGPTLPDLARAIAFAHLAHLRPEEPNGFRALPEDEYLERRRKLVAKIRALVNPGDSGERPPFVVLFGKPGMGKSVLMNLLSADMKGWGWTVLPFACRAGRRCQCQEFIKTLAYTLATSFGEIHSRYDDFIELSEDADTAALGRCFRTLVYEPLCEVSKICRASHRKIVMVIDGIDEDVHGQILDILLNPVFVMPKGVGIVVSSRRVPQDMNRIEAKSTGIVDLNGDDQKINNDCYTDIRSYIELWLLRDSRVKKALLEANISSEEAKNTIYGKDPSFIYAYHVLNGIAEGRYSLDRLKSEIPGDLCAAFYDSFRARFPTPSDYLAVKPLLQLLLKDGTARLPDAENCVRPGGMPLGKTIQRLRGYVVVEGQQIILTSEPLREWLVDCVRNPDFGIMR